MYAPFELDIPNDLAGALAALANGAGETVLPIAGGTNLIVDIRARRERPDRMVGLGEVDELLGMEFGTERISIGGRTTVSDLLRAPEIAAAAPSLVDAARLFGGLMVRNTGTVAGNIASGSPAADLVPPLLTLDAELTLSCATSTRTLALDDYYLGYKQDARRPDELITRISWPRLPEKSSNTFYKLARRKGDAITVTGVAVTLAVANGHLHHGTHCAGLRRAHRAARQAGRGAAGGPGADPCPDRRGGRCGGRRMQPHRRYPGVGRLPAPHGPCPDPAPARPGVGPAGLRE